MLCGRLARKVHYICFSFSCYGGSAIAFVYDSGDRCTQAEKNFDHERVHHLDVFLSANHDGVSISSTRIA